MDAGLLTKYNLCSVLLLQIAINVKVRIKLYTVATMLYIWSSAIHCSMVFL